MKGGKQQNGETRKKEHERRQDGEGGKDEESRRGERDQNNGIRR